MANEDQHELAQGATPSAGQLPPGISRQGAARRRFAKAGLGASGVILTMTSQPGMATEMTCSGASAFGYLTPASHTHAKTACDGRSPGYWKNWPNQWQGAYTSSAAKFGDTFNCFGISSTLPQMTLLETLDPPKEFKKGGVDPDPDNVARHIIAALLNARSGRVPQLPETKVFEIWNDYARTGHYSPRPDTDWDGAMIVIYLQSTMDKK